MEKNTGITMLLGAGILVFGLASCTVLDGRIFVSRIARVQENNKGANEDSVHRVFIADFETQADFDGFYIVPRGSFDSDHELSANDFVSGENSHTAWIIRARSDTNSGRKYLPHRAYPTIQFQNTASGPMRTPCLVSLYVKLDVSLIDRTEGEIDDWFSLATLSPDTSKYWTRTVGVNLTPDGYLKLVHVPDQGQQDRTFQASTLSDPEGLLRFPLNEWTRLDIYIDFDKDHGMAKVWQNGELVSEASVRGGKGALAQTHFGLYASAAVERATVWNDLLVIREVANEKDALSFLENTSD